MRVGIEKGFNPFYDSKFRISIEGEKKPQNRMLAELDVDELLRLQNEVIDLLSRMGINTRTCMENKKDNYEPSVSSR